MGKLLGSAVMRQRRILRQQAVNPGVAKVAERREELAASGYPGSYGLKTLGKISRMGYKSRRAA